jgi:hypothetical protein
MRKRIEIVMVIAVVLATGLLSSRGGADAGKSAYLPIVVNGDSVVSTDPDLPVINLPYIQAADVPKTNLIDMSIFWYGKVMPDTNYTDVRIGYSDEALWLYMEVFDRRLWYNNTQDGTALENWDAATLLLNTDEASQTTSINSKSYRFVAQFYGWSKYSDGRDYKSAYRGDGSSWSSQSMEFSIVPGWRGNALNDNVDDRGWVMTYKIPFTSLGLTGKPANGAVWRIALQTHDRDAAGVTLPDQVWPNGLQRDNPTTWGQIRFGLPGYTSPAVTNPQTTTIRHKLNGAIVKDVAVGGASTCGDGLDFFSQWGTANYAGASDFNVQNQANVDDWPCFSKYYVTFPLTSIPPGKAIQSAKLILHEWGGSLPSLAKPSLVQVMRIPTTNWQEGTLNWNNGPQVLENISRALVPVYNPPNFTWPGNPVEWDMSRAVAQAYQENVPLMIVIYSADNEYNSGKYFISSDTGDWNETGRPTLVVNWGNPQ